MKKIKVMILHNMVTPYRLPLFEELSKKYDLTVYFCKEKTEDRKWSTKLDNYSFKHKILPHKDFGKFVINPSLKRELSKKDYNVYICGDNPESFFQCLTIISFCKSNNKPFIFWSGNTLEGIKYYYSLNESTFGKIFFKIQRIIENIYLNRVKNNSEAFISYSNSTKNFLVSKKFPIEKIFVGTQNYPESLLLKPTWKSKPKEYKNKKIIFHMGYLNKRKGVDYIIKAFNNLKRKDTLLLIAGSGDQEDKLKKLAKDNKNIRFVGYKEGVEKANYYSIADFCVFFTLHDPWSHVIAESFYYGVPVISSIKDKAIELIEEGKTGFIIPSENVNALTKAMKKLLNNPQLLKKMKENVKKIPKSKIVDIKTSAKTFEKAINYTMEVSNEYSSN